MFAQTILLYNSVFKYLMVLGVLIGRKLIMTKSREGCERTLTYMNYFDDSQSTVIYCMGQKIL